MSHIRNPAGIFNSPFNKDLLRGGVLNIPGNDQKMAPRTAPRKSLSGSQNQKPGTLGAALEVQKITIGMQNSILGKASHDLCNAKTTILGATSGAIPGNDGNPHERFSFAYAFSERFFKNWGGPRAPEQMVLPRFPISGLCKGSTRLQSQGPEDPCPCEKFIRHRPPGSIWHRFSLCHKSIVAHVCGDPLSRYTCRTRFPQHPGVFRCSGDAKGDRSLFSVSVTFW